MLQDNSDQTTLDFDYEPEADAADPFRVVSYGMGLDSTAMLVLMARAGIRPDLIIFSDTGGETPETYAYLDVINAWLREQGFPTVTVVQYEPTRAPYTTLEGKCIENQTLPSLAFGGHSCALVFKRDVMVKYLKGLNIEGPIEKFIGYDDSKADRRRRAKSDRVTDKLRLKVVARAEQGRAPLADQWEANRCSFRYLLQEQGLERPALAAIIEAAGLPVPDKSACFFCPATKPSEVVALKLKHPDLYERAVAMERGARDGRHGLQTKAGLGMGGWAWEWLRDCDDPSAAADFLKARGAKVAAGARP